MAAPIRGAGTDPNARREGMSRTETPQYWVASSDDLGVFEALVKARAGIAALAGSIDGGTPLDDAVEYGCRSRSA